MILGDDDILNNRLYETALQGDIGIEKQFAHLGRFLRSLGTCKRLDRTGHQLFICDDLTPQAGSLVLYRVKLNQKALMRFHPKVGRKLPEVGFFPLRYCKLSLELSDTL